MAWVKLGLLFKPTGQYGWMNSHATVPTPLYLDGDIYRIYFSSRDKLNRNQVGYIEIDINNPHQILAISEEPVISCGKLGYFDCDGVYGTTLVEHKGQLRFYYAGWNAGIRGVFYSSIGMAISTDGGKTFDKYQEVPLLARDIIDKWAVMAPFVLKVDDDKWIMWYASGIKLYHNEKGDLKSYYDIKIAFSEDGLNWTKTGQSAIALDDKTSNIARACVVNEQNGFSAWYPYVDKELGQYRIGYGTSIDGLAFKREDSSLNASISVSGDEHDWDGLAVTYPYVFKHKGKQYMLYNGNGFGKTGFGLAVWES